MCGCNGGSARIRTMTPEELIAEQDQRRAESLAAREAYAASMRAAMENAGGTPELVDA